ncbi:hypothetical protein DSECCO2_573630 [anaerobic digester metagenome]
MLKTFEAGIACFGYRFIGSPDWSLYTVTCDFFHQKCIGGIVVQGKKFQNSLENILNAMTVESDDTAVDRSRRKIAVPDDKLITMAHLHEDFQKLGAQDGRNSFQHRVLLYNLDCNCLNRVRYYT